MKRAKEFELEYLLEPFAGDLTFFTKRMFGGMAAYFGGKMVMMLTEDKNSRSYKGKEFPFLIWNGGLIPTDRSDHASLLKDFPGLIPHPILGKWLYLSLEEDLFEEHSEKLIDRILEYDARIGILPKERSKSSKAPRWIHNLKNIGPNTAEELKQIGITSVKQFFEAGWEEVYCRLVLAYPHRNNLNMLSSLMGAFEGVDWRHISEQDKFEAKKWVNFFKK